MSESITIEQLHVRLAAQEAITEILMRVFIKSPEDMAAFDAGMAAWLEGRQKAFSEGHREFTETQMDDLATELADVTHFLKL
ncbi:hypothetical protein CY652_01340 [Burkholderia sp. WAC0059]|uniref:hypothetical protein n=1 Tax=Burkholderia sp. WAC0059 TaxID=2066022 RepID=UPI000C7F5465|nr:hypothetical protein [Burkholderia sp. WAC0059]PLZ04344.1 hypothetical protein CY652_01340 [Burkholderia sp. WAC0059]